ncbi:MAG: hypothetical protein P0S95_06195 [Rhabdochlamydiaceae bacterium]|nr:hypothetical protein [Candidatus Amphrikana amoebophyrae]
MKKFLYVFGAGSAIICIAYGMFWTFLMKQFQDSVANEIEKNKLILKVDCTSIKWKFDPTKLSLVYNSPNIELNNSKIRSVGSITVSTSLLDKSAGLLVNGPFFIQTGESNEFRVDGTIFYEKENIVEYLKANSKPQTTSKLLSNLDAISIKFRDLKVSIFEDGKTLTLIEMVKGDVSLGELEKVGDLTIRNITLDYRDVTSCERLIGEYIKLIPSLNKYQNLYVSTKKTTTKKSKCNIRLGTVFNTLNFDENLDLKHLFPLSLEVNNCDFRTDLYSYQGDLSLNLSLEDVNNPQMVVKLKTSGKTDYSKFDIKAQDVKENYLQAFASLSKSKQTFLVQDYIDKNWESEILPLIPDLRQLGVLTHAIDLELKAATATGQKQDDERLMLNLNRCEFNSNLSKISLNGKMVRLDPLKTNWNVTFSISNFEKMFTLGVNKYMHLRNYLVGLGIRKNEELPVFNDAVISTALDLAFKFGDEALAKNGTLKIDSSFDSMNNTIQIGPYQNQDIEPVVSGYLDGVLFDMYPHLKPEESKSVVLAP